MHRRAWKMFSAVGLAVLAVVGCRDKDPTPSFYRNLGTQDVPLLPTASVIHDVSLLKGTADWVPFRDLAQAEAGTPSEDATSSGDSNAETEAEIRDLLKDYNELVADRDIDELIVYHIESHQDTAKLWYEVQFSLMDKVGEIQTALTSALPDSQARIEQAFAPVVAAVTGLSVDTLTVESDELVVGKLAEGGVAAMCRFVIVDDEWFIDLPDFPETFAQLKSEVDGSMAMIDAVKAGLASGTMLADQVLAQLEAVFASQPPDAEATTADNDGGEDSPDGSPEETDGDSSATDSD
ncbi:MAG: hypothetical protein IH987_08100 [Planctomycetes bacterium]|nr:hypothetical protein [Planctomycetota bacterium]